MKIIATTENGFICEVSKTEISAALGMLSKAEDMAKLKIGSDITFTKTLHNLALIRDMSGNEIHKLSIKLTM